MEREPDLPDPSSPFIDRLDADDAFHREAAAESLGSLGSPRAARPLAGLLLRELRSVERTGVLAHTTVVRAVTVAIRRIGAIEALYALVRALCALSRARRVDEDLVKEIVESLAEVGGPAAVREAADRVVKSVREGGETAPGLEAVGSILLERLGFCGDAGIATLRRVAQAGPSPLKPMARRALTLI